MFLAKLGQLVPREREAMIFRAVIASDLSAAARRAKAEAKQSMPPHKEKDGLLRRYRSSQ
jgi:hypothetical protein